MTKTPRKIDLAEQRKELGTQAEVAEQLGLVRETISRMERMGDEAPTWYRWALYGLRARKGL